MTVLRSSLVLLPALLLLNACAFGNGDTAQNYVLTVPVVQTNKAPLHHNIEVLSVEVAAGLDTARIAFIQNDMQMNYLEGSRWAAPLPEMLQDMWVAALRQSHLTSSVSSDFSGVKADRLIHITANSFEAVRDENDAIIVKVDYDIKMLAPISRNVLLVEEAHVEKKALALDKESVMRTFNIANATAMTELIQKLSEKLK